MVVSRCIIHVNDDVEYSWHFLRQLHQLLLIILIPPIASMYGLVYLPTHLPEKNNHSCRCKYTIHGWYAIVLLEAGYLFASCRVGRLPVFLRG